MFLIMNSIGHISAYLDLVETLNKNRRRKIIIREMLFALLIMLFFHYVGEFLLTALDVSLQTVFIAGGIILFLIAIRMIFPETKLPLPPVEREEPFIFPIAMPMIAGPSILTTIMLYAYRDKTGQIIIVAILIAWALSIIVLLFAEEIKKIVGKRTLIACERLMGLILTMMAVEMVLNGAKSIALDGIK
jgi:multiple antibiotic resistance protein